MKIQLYGLSLGLCLVSATAWLGTGCAGDRYRQSTGEQIDDSATSSRVKHAGGIVESRTGIVRSEPTPMTLRQPPVSRSAKREFAREATSLALRRSLVPWGAWQRPLEGGGADQGGRWRQFAPGDCAKLFRALPVGSRFSDTAQKLSAKTSQFQLTTLL